MKTIPEANLARKDKIIDWHERFAHCSGSKLKSIAQYNKSLEKINLPEQIICITCELANIKMKPFTYNNSNLSIVEVLGIDLCGPF
jgi:hypothetical protein